MEKLENIIVGSGPAGRLAGLELGKLKKEVLLIEKKYIAGNCLNEGCMVICALNEIARFTNSKKRYEKLGILKGEIELNYEKITKKIKETQAIIRKIHEKENKSIGNKIIFSEAEVFEDNVCVNGESYAFEKLLIATGSKPIIPKIPGNEYGLTSKDILNIKKLPKKINIIGAGEIGVELSSLFSSFGCEVNLIARGEILKHMDKDLKNYVEKKLLKDVNIYKNLETIEIKKNKVITQIGEFEGKTLIAAGRTPNSKLVEDILELNEDNSIKVDPFMKSSKSNVYAAGDVVGGINLTTVARREGIIAARNMAGYSTIMDYTNIPLGLTLDMDTSYVEIPGKISNNNENISIPGSAGPGSFWRVLTRDTGFSKISYNKITGKIDGAYSISPSSVSDISYFSYLMEHEDLEDFNEEFIEIHPSTNVFQHLINAIY
ncbi:MAG: NAD(P)/FAD-dependent oxidoreductase [Methanobrevibacter sp.]|jgi:dihydrolipoamide dehydrogenase|nr:NAD(P)/FAD-dependent oxidoreductase [Methanobrevibacter sp.]